MRAMMKSLILILAVFSMGYLHASNETIIILNGPSSSGKSSIQKALQKQADQDYLRIGIDTFFDALIEEPDLSTFEEDKEFHQYTPQGEYIRGIKLEEDEEGSPMVSLFIGPAGDRIIFGMHRAIAAYADAGNNLIVDYILYKPTWAADLKEVLVNHNVYTIKVNAPLDVIEQREIERNTSPRGHARSHYHTVHDGMQYDLEIDTSVETPESAAKKILQLVKTAQ